MRDIASIMVVGATLIIAVSAFFHKILAIKEIKCDINDHEVRIRENREVVVRIEETIQSIKADTIVLTNNLAEMKRIVSAGHN